MRARYEALTERFVIVSAELTNARKSGRKEYELLEKIKVLEADIEHHRHGYTHSDEEYE